MVDYREEFYAARWHLDVAKRMLGSFDEYGGKRFLVGVIREGAKGAGRLVRAFLIFDKTRGNLRVFREKVGLKYLDSLAVENLVKILMLERDQKRARVEFVREVGGDAEILMEVSGKWKGIRVSRLREFVDSIEDVICNFPASIKR